MSRRPVELEARTQVFNVRWTPRDVEGLRRLARERGVTITEVIRAAVKAVLGGAREEVKS